MSTYGTFKTDRDMERDGIVLDYGPAGRFIVARAGGSNKQFNKRLNKLSMPHRKAINAGRLDEEIADQLLMTAWVDCCLKGWEGVTGPEGGELPFTKENATRLFTDLPDLWRELVSDSQNAAMYREEILDADSGN